MKYNPNKKTLTIGQNTGITVSVALVLMFAGGISAIYYSGLDTPYGFIKDSGRWRVEAVIGSDSSQTSATAGTWYNLGSIKLNAPIGYWRLGYETVCQATNGSGGPDQFTTLSTANNSESDKFMSTRVLSSAGNTTIAGLAFRSKFVNLSSVVDYYLNHKAQINSTTTIQQLGATFGGTVYLDCAYV